MKKRTFATGLLSLLLAGAVCATTPVKQSKTVRVPVLVSGPKDSHVLTLKQSHFRLFDEGVPRPISAFMEPNQPIDIDIIVAINVIKGNRAPAGVTDLWDSIEKFKQVGNSANKYTIDELSHGVDGLFEAISRHVDKLSKSANPRRALVVWAGGMDVGGGPAGRRLAERVRSMNVPIYIRAGQGFCAESEIAAQANCGDSVLVYDEISMVSGGHRVLPIGVKNRDESLLELAEELRDQYVLSFEATGAAEGKWRDLSVKVSAPAVTTTLKPKTPSRYFVAPTR